MGSFYIGIDDTDNDTSLWHWPAWRRRLGIRREIESRGAKVNGITRHQFLVDPRIPYTSHNSGRVPRRRLAGPDQTGLGLRSI